MSARSRAARDLAHRAIQNAVREMNSARFMSFARSRSACDSSRAEREIAQREISRSFLARGRQILSRSAISRARLNMFNLARDLARVFKVISYHPRGCEVGGASSRQGETQNVGKFQSSARVWRRGLFCGSNKSYAITLEADRVNRSLHQRRSYFKHYYYGTYMQHKNNA